jgi:hypothetical protein
MEEFTAFDDDLYKPTTNNNSVLLITHMEKSLEASSKWLRQSRLKVNKEKEEL